MSEVHVQCAKCPWKVSVDPYDIPDGYCPVKHAALKNTIAEPGSIAGIGNPMRLMECHMPGEAQMCIGWVDNQLGAGNNIKLRLRFLSRPFHYELVGEQHSTFEDTLPITGEKR